MDAITIRGYKSIRDATVELRPINILIGANGAGKSNFLSFFDLLNNLYHQKLKEYVALNGGVDKMLFEGKKVTEEVHAYLCFSNSEGYSFTIKSGDIHFVFTEEEAQSLSAWRWENFSSESQIKSDHDFPLSNIKQHLESFKKYHFHDTGKNSPFNQLSHTENDSYLLYNQGSNLAAFLYDIQKTNSIVYQRIVKTIRSVASYFSDFFFQPNPENYIRLQWQNQYSDSVYGTNDLSNGTIRFIALVVLFMQPNLPDTLIIDEPELGLHPTAIAKLAGMMKSAASRGTQVIVATQSSDLISYFSPEDVITVDMEDGASTFNRLSEDDLSIWLEEYSLGDLWKRSIIAGGQP